METLFKMEKLSKMIPQDDSRTIKALEDFSELNKKFEQLSQGAQQPLDADENPELSEEQVEQEAEKKEMQTKKLMTVVKSKYFMLKANFPKAALEVDSEPIIDNHIPDMPKKA